MSSIALSIGGKVTEIGAERLPQLFRKNPYMHEIYPTAESAAALTVFQIYAGKGEWFDLSKKPIERDSFTFGEIKAVQNGYVIGAECCGIRQQNCLHCGACFETCPVKAIERF